MSLGRRPRGLSSDRRSAELGRTQIADAWLVHLKGLTNLRRLELTGTKVTAAGVADLQKELPNCKIEK